jgi:hypothetical protein
MALLPCVPETPRGSEKFAGPHITLFDPGLCFCSGLCVDPGRATTAPGDASVLPIRLHLKGLRHFFSGCRCNHGVLGPNDKTRPHPLPGRRPAQAGRWP